MTFMKSLVHKAVPRQVLPQGIHGLKKNLRIPATHINVIYQHNA